MTDYSATPSPGVPYVGQRISLISKSAIRYVGTLYTIDTKASTVALKDVRSYGTEGRQREGGPVEPSDRVYTFIVFRGPDITDLQFLPKDSDVPVAAPQQQQHNPPAPHTQQIPALVTRPQHTPAQRQVQPVVTAPRPKQEEGMSGAAQTKQESREEMRQRPAVRGPTPRAWGPPPVPPKEMRQQYVNRQPVQPIAPKAPGEASNGYTYVNGHTVTENGGVPQGLGVENRSGGSAQVSGASVSGANVAVSNGMVHKVDVSSNGVTDGAEATGHRDVYGGAHGRNEGAIPGAADGVNVAEMNTGERGSRGGRGRGRGRGGRYHGGSWRRGPGIKIPDEDFDFASMQEKLKAVHLGPNGKLGGEEEFGHIEVCYDKSKSFFDELVPEKAMRTERVNAAQRRATDFETFGETGPGYRSGYRNGRGRRGRGRGRGRGGRHGGGSGFGGDGGVGLK